MKKLFTIGTLALCVSGLFAQHQAPSDDYYTEKIKRELSQPESQMTPEQAKYFQDYRQALIKNANDKAATVEGIANFVEIIDANPDSDIANSFFSIWPDSLTEIEYTNTTDNAPNHGFGAFYDPVFDNKEGWTRAGLNFTVDDTVYVDTLYMEGLYFKNQPAFDTMRFHAIVNPMVSGNTSPFSSVYWQAGTFPNLPATLEPTMLTFDYAGDPSHGTQGNIIGPITQSYSYGLNGDSGLTVIKIPLGLTLLPGNGLAVYATYHPEPGSWTPGDLISLVNRTGPNIWRNVVYNNADDNDESSYWVHYTEDTRTNNNNFCLSKTRYGAHVGDDAWRNDQTSANSAIASLIYFYVRGTSTSVVGIDEPTVTSNIALKNNYPNPANGMTTIEYGIKNSSNVALEVTDITGKVILSQNEGNKTAGTYKIQLDVSALNSGVYYYSIITDNGKATKKMIVLE